MADNPGDDLERRIKDARARHASPQDTHKNRDDSGAMSSAFRAGTDLVAAVIVGGGLGFWADKVLGTKPLLMILMVFCGFAAGFLNIYRRETGQEFKIGFKNDRASGNDEEEE